MQTQCVTNRRGQINMLCASGDMAATPTICPGARISDNEWNLIALPEESKLPKLVVV